MDLTEIVLVAIALVALALEVWAMAARRWPERVPAPHPRLISPVMRDDGRLWLFWPWGWGVLPGHWWYPTAAHERAWIGLVAATVALVAVDLVVFRRREDTPKAAPFVVFLAGIAAGAFCWAMGA